MARWQFTGGSGREFPLYQLDVVPGDVVDCSVCPDAVFFRQTGDATPVTASLTFPASVTTVDGAALNVRGARQPSTAYAVNDAVCHDGQVWRCVVAYTSNGSDYFAPAQAVHWTRATITNTPPGNGTFAPLASPALTGTPTVNGATVEDRTHAAATYGLLGATPPGSKIPAGRVTTPIVNFGIAGHGWTANTAAATSNMNDTATFARGTQSAKLTTKGDGGVAAIKNSAMSAVNLTGKALEVSVMVDDWTHAASLLLYVGDTSFANFRVVTLWNSTSATNGQGGNVKPADNGEWVTLTIDLSSIASTTGAPTISAVTSMQVAIQDDNTGNAVTMHANHIAHFPAVNSGYPNGLVSFTFDDSYASQYSVARPALDKYGYRGTFYTITGAIGTGGYMTLAQLRSMQDVSGHEIAPHASSVAAHNAVGAYTSLSATDLDTELRSLKNWMVANGFRGRDHFAYPQGLRNAATEAAVRAYYSSARYTLDKPIETSSPNHPLRLRTVKCNVPKTLASAKTDVDNAVANGSWLIFTIHDLATTVPSGSGLVEWASQDFRDLVDYVATKSCIVRSVGDALATL